MSKSWKDKANQVLKNMGQKLPVERGCTGWWGEVELPDCLRAELEESDGLQED